MRAGNSALEEEMLKKLRVETKIKLRKNLSNKIFIKKRKHTYQNEQRKIQ